MWSGGRARTNQGQMRTVPGERLRGTGLGSGFKNVVESRAAIFTVFVLFLRQNAVFIYFTQK